MSDEHARTDWELFNEWCAGDSGAGDRLLLRHFELLMRFFYTKVRAADVDDLVAETYLACTASKERFSPSGSFKSLLFSIAVNKLREYYRKQVKRRSESDDFDVLCVSDVDDALPSESLSRKQEVRVLVRALRRLPLSQQIAIELNYFEGLTGPDIAELLGLPPATVYTQLRRGKLRLAELVRELSDSPRLAETTLMGLETWALMIREHIGP